MRDIAPVAACSIAVRMSESISFSRTTMAKAGRIRMTAPYSPELLFN
jgi:hypothetical protein